MKKEFLTGINNFCEHSHSIDKGKYVYTSKMYKDLARSLNHDFMSAENIDSKKYEKFLNF